MLLHVQILCVNLACRSTNSATGRRTSTAAHHVHSSDTAAEAVSNCGTSSISNPADEDNGEPGTAAATAGRRTTGGALRGHQEQHDAAESAAAATAAGRATAERPGTDTPPGENDCCECGGRQHRAEVDVDDTGRRVELTHRHDAGVARHRDAAYRAGSGTLYQGDNATAASRGKRHRRRQSAAEAGSGVAGDADGGGDAGEDAGRTADTHQDRRARCCSGDVDCSGGRYPQRGVDGEGGGGSDGGEVHGDAPGGAAR